MRAATLPVTMTLQELAPAKINLTLRVAGRRPDGYHELSSVVAFAGVADVLTLVPGDAVSLEITGPFASAIDGDNLVLKAVRLALEAEPALRTGRFHLTKNLPVAAGIGGGSADAAAALRLLQRLDPSLAAGVDWHDVARRIGADVPACLAGRALHMGGIGEVLTPLPPLPRVPAVLVNPRVPLATGPVFAALAAPLLPADAGTVAPVLPCHAVALQSWIAANGNDLESPAKYLCAAIGDVLDALRASDGVRLARMSGSGPTCFGLFATEAAADTASRTLAAARPGWWVAATTIG